ncbi:Mitogen-activated protein kinase kinase kinase 1 [Abeliophyllum distichum]|uniref:mitogen-activated protein kinase kinase kinase n=1 Tax=Abeliophyllum distichum TaxID=126358 RepID=A0ABD1SA24_9LAMI
MHRIPKFLVHSSDRSKTSMNSRSSSGGSRRKQKPQPPRLERRNANNNINYELCPSTPSTSSSSYYSSEDSSLRTRSLELYSDKKSFRIEGIDGEIEIICNALGFSGIDDFGISTAEYENMKVRSSSAPLIVNQKIEADTSNLDAGIIDDVGSRISNVIISDKNEGFSDLRAFVINRVTDNPSVSGRVDELAERLGDGVSASDQILSENVSTVLDEFRGNGIKGQRPPVLLPVPGLTLPVIENSRSTWDLPLEGERVPGFVFSLEDGEGQEEHGGRRSEEQEEDREEDNMRRVFMRSGMLSRSPSFTTSNDDDSSSTTTDPTSNISPNWRFRRIIMDWQKGELLGRGSFGTVYEGIADGGFFFAVKEVSLLDQGDEGKQSIIQLEQEIALLSQFEHENIVQYYGATKDESNLYIFLELVTKGSLLSLYQKYNLQDSQVSAYTRQILHGLKYLHDRNVVHRNIKCANILVDANGSVKLADFGLAKCWSIQSHIERMELKQKEEKLKNKNYNAFLFSLVSEMAIKFNDVESCNRTVFWMAPEVVKSRGYGNAADIWSLGCTVLEMLTRQFPYINLECAIKFNDVESCNRTVFWMAPEVVKSRGYGNAADIWSLGCTVLEMLTRQFPYFNLECMLALFKIGKGDRPECTLHCHPAIGPSICEANASIILRLSISFQI